MIYELSGLRAERFVTLGEEVRPGDYGLADAQALRLTFADGTEQVVLVGDATESGGRFAMIRGEDRVFEVSAEASRRLALGRAELVER